MEQQKNFAVLIDADNVSPERFERIFGEISLWGNATYRRIYGNWAEYNRAALKEKLVEFGLTPVQQFNYIKGKNATDIALVIDAMDILYTGKVDGFAIVTNDSDFTRLALRLRESGMTVIGMGDDVAPAAFRAACTDFVVLRESRRIAEELSAQKTLRLVSRRSGRSARRTEEVQEKELESKEVPAAAPVAEPVDNAPASVPSPARQVLSDRELREDIKSILTDTVDNDGWLSASTLINLLKARHEGLDIKDYEHLPLFAGKRKIWTTYFLSLGFCESLQKGPSNFQLRIRAEERRKVLAERDVRGNSVKSAPAADKVHEKVEITAVPEKAEASNAPAAAPALASVSVNESAAQERAPGQGRRRNRRGRKPAGAGNAQAEAAKAETPKDEAPKAETEAKASAPKAEAPKNEAPKTEAEAKAEPAKTEPVKAEPAKAEAAETAQTKAGTRTNARAKAGAARARAAKADAKAENASAEPAKTETPKTEEVKAEASKTEAPAASETKAEAPKAKASKTAAKAKAAKAEVKAEVKGEEKVEAKVEETKPEAQAEAPKKTTRRRKTVAKTDS